MPRDEKTILSERVSVKEQQLSILKKERAANTTFHQFVKDNWSILEPANPFIDNWTTGALTEHLTACAHRQIRRLAINIFFRSAKSRIISVFFPAWVWATINPAERFLCASFAEDLAMRDADHSRLLITSQQYQSNYGARFQIRKDQSAKGYYENDKTGNRRSIGTNGMTTGFGGGIRLLDDPNDTRKTESKVIRDATNDWFDKTWSSRSDDFTKDVSIVVQQRTHKQDVTGHIIENDLGYELLRIPLEYDGKKYVTSLGWTDPRTTLGESADPIRFPREVINELKKTLHIAYHGQAQQEPTSPEGDVIKKAWYNSVYMLPVRKEEGKFIWADGIKFQGYCDLAGSDNPDMDRTAMNVHLRFPDGKIVKLWHWFGHWTPLTRNKEIQNFYSAWNDIIPGMPIHFEANNILGSDGMETLHKQLLAAGLNVRKDYARVSKVDRAINQKDSYIASAEGGMIDFYQGDLFTELMTAFGTPQSWRNEFFEESCSLYYKEVNGKMEFAGGHKDLLDSDIGCFNKLTNSKKPSSWEV